MKIRTNKAIIYLWDLETDMPRRIIFGDPSELYDFFVEQSEILHTRLRKLNKDYKGKEALEEAIVDTREGFEIDNSHAAVEEDHLIEFSYKIIKNPSKTK